MSAPVETVWNLEAHVDEIMPGGRPTPGDWAVQCDGQWRLRNEHGDPGEPLQDGEIVAFLRHDIYGSATMTWRAADDFDISAPMPAGATQCCALDGWQVDTLSANPEELARQLANCDDVEPGDEFEISYYHWTDPIQHRFIAATGEFVVVQ